MMRCWSTVLRNAKVLQGMTEIERESDERERVIWSVNCVIKFEWSEDKGVKVCIPRYMCIGVLLSA